MKVTIETHETKTYTYSFSFIDNLGAKTTKEGFGSLEDAKKHIKKHMRSIRKKEFEIVEL